MKRHGVMSEPLKPVKARQATKKALLRLFTRLPHPAAPPAKPGDGPLGDPVDRHGDHTPEVD